MDIQKARAILARSTREELRDHAFGDAEIYWVDYSIPGEFNGGTEVGFSYLGGSGPLFVGVTDPSTGEDITFKEDEARQLLMLGSSVRVERNDSTGPDQFTPGKCMPGLTLEGMREELTRKPE